MRHRLLMGLCALGIGLGWGVLWATAQSMQATQEITPTPVSTDDLRVFPEDLVCARREELSGTDGPSWMGILIGMSTLDDVEELLLTSDNYVFIDDDNYVTRFVIWEPSPCESHIPSIVRLCLEGDIVQVLAVDCPLASCPYLSDFVVQFGEPDAITWTSNSTSRIAFWFGQGIAAEITVIPNEQGYEPTFGRVATQIYFPYQRIDGYENRWPYNQTRQFNQFLSWPYEGRDDYGPENPFDFNAMIATITAEPSRTPTPTFAPRSSTATATAAP